MGLHVELDYLDFFAGDLRSADYTTLNPNAKVPTLIDGDFTLSESNAINVYLAGLRPTLGLSRLRTHARGHRALALLGARALQSRARRAGLRDRPQTGLHEDGARCCRNRDRAPRFGAFRAGSRAAFARLPLHGRRQPHAGSLRSGQIEAFRNLVPFDWSPYPSLNAFYERLADDPHWVATAPRDAQAIGRRPS